MEQQVTLTAEELGEAIRELRGIRRKLWSFVNQEQHPEPWLCRMHASLDRLVKNLEAKERRSCLKSGTSSTTT